MRASLPTTVSTKRLLPALLAVVLFFLALAVFSPLHQHGPDGQCSLNGFEFVVQAETETCVPTVVLSVFAFHEVFAAPADFQGLPPSSAFLRGPPSAA